MAKEKLNPAARWFATICLAGFILSGCLWYLLPSDFHPLRNGEMKSQSIPFKPLSKSLPESTPSVASPAPIAPSPAPQQATILQSVDPGSAPPQNRPMENRLPSLTPPLAGPLKLTEKASACLAGDPELRDLFTTKLQQSITGKIVSGDCSAIEGPVVTVSGVASKLATSDPACKTIDGHLYEVFFSISRPGSTVEISRTVSAARCSSRIKNEDTALGREAKNQAVLLGVISLRDLLQNFTEN